MYFRALPYACHGNFCTFYLAKYSVCKGFGGSRLVEKDLAQKRLAPQVLGCCPGFCLVRARRCFKVSAEFEPQSAENPSLHGASALVADQTRGLERKGLGRESSHVVPIRAYEM